MIQIKRGKCTHGRAENGYKSVVRKSIGMRSLGMPKHRWGINIKNNLKKQIINVS
jgi:hypothetical protein